MKKHVLPALTCLLLAACATETSAPERITAPAPAAEAEAAETAVADAQPVEPLDAKRLMGLSPKAVQALMGEPTLVRRENNVQVMLFEDASCVLEVVFYEPTADAHFEARTVEARSRRGQAVDTETCLGALLPDGHWRTH